MIFSELYSAYYNAVARILAEAVRGNGDEGRLREIVQRYAFSESILTVIPSLKSEKWQLLAPDGTTPLRNIPSMPETLLEKRWLKALASDPRIGLFGLSFEGLEDVTPLFTPEDFDIYDQYADGDPYGDEEYISRFRLILQAIRTKRPLKVEIVNRRGKTVQMNLLPLRLEYSEKDDKFRLIASGCRYGKVVNLGRMVSCRPYYGKNLLAPDDVAEDQRSVTLKIFDERNTMERCLLHFAHFEKQAERIGERNYLVRIRYSAEDETEMVIRVLSFGPMVEVTEPAAFRELIIERLKRQKSCEL